MPILVIYSNYKFCNNEKIQTEYKLKYTLKCTLVPNLYIHSNVLQNAVRLLQFSVSVPHVLITVFLLFHIGQFKCIFRILFFVLAETVS